MTSFGRVVRIALRQRWTFIASLACSLGVALLWSGNITAIYPIVELTLHNESPAEWIQDEIKSIESTVAELEQAGADGDLDRPTQAGVAAVDSTRLAAERRALSAYKRIQPYVERYAPRRAFDTLVAVCVLLIIGTCLKGVLRIAGQILTARLAGQTALQLRQEFFRNTMRLDLARCDESGRGDLVNRFTSDLGCSALGVHTLLGSAVLQPLKMLMCLVGAAWISWRLLLITMVVTPLAAWTIAWLAKSIKRTHRRAMAELSTIYEVLNESLGNMKVIRAYTTEDYECQRFNSAAKKYYKNNMKIARYKSLTSPSAEMMGMLMVILAVLAGGYMVLNQQTHLFGFLRISDRPMDPSSLTLFFAFLAGASDPARRLSGLFTSVQQAIASSERVFELLDRQPELVDPPAPQTIPTPLSELRLENVSFGYGGDQLTVQNIDLTVKSGEAIALVGPNGCGKTTLLSLLLRFYDPSDGSITMNGVDIRQVEMQALRRKIGLVTQESFLFNDTIAANIRYGNSDAPDESVIEAAKQAYAHSFITEKLSLGYETVVGPSGNRLSGGQRQRIALARAILRDPEILLLDEATSQIDVQSEQAIHAGLAAFMQGRTSILVTHRASTLDLVDRIVVMNGGRIEDVGCHEELIARCEFYRNLHSSGLRASA